MKHLALITLVAVAIGCGSSEPEHPEKPLAKPPPPSTAMSPSSSAEEKIKYIENSKAPDDVKKDAIAKIKAGQL